MYIFSTYQTSVSSLSFFYCAVETFKNGQEFICIYCNLNHSLKSCNDLHSSYLVIIRNEYWMIYNITSIVLPITVFETFCCTIYVPFFFLLTSLQLEYEMNNLVQTSTLVNPIY